MLKFTNALTGKPIAINPQHVSAVAEGAHGSDEKGEGKSVVTLSNPGGGVFNVFLQEAIGEVSSAVAKWIEDFAIRTIGGGAKKAKK
jgi:hypothetical protein